MAKEIITTKPQINVKGKLLDLSHPRVMGVMNLNRDSFYQGSRIEREHVLQKAEEMVGQGVDILDMGGYSTRPGAQEISEEEEIERISKPVEWVCREFDIPVSIDTFRAPVAEVALNQGACMINDVSGGSLDEDMFGLVAHKNVPYILMHMRGNPQTMTGFTGYNNLILEVMAELQEKLAQLNAMGVSDIIVDPGLGFAKSLAQNYDLLKNLDYFKALERPLLVGLSRKSMIQKVLNVSAEEALNGTTALNMIALMNGASILRVHDVKEAVEVIRLYKTLNQGVND